MGNAIDQPLNANEKEYLQLLARKFLIQPFFLAAREKMEGYHLFNNRSLIASSNLSATCLLSRLHYRHHDYCVLFTGTGRSQNQVHYWSLYDNKILRKFRGHTDGITNLSMSPLEDLFLTASKDRTVRLWDAEQAGCLGKMDLPSNAEGNPSVVFDSTGLVFAVMAQMTRGQGNVCASGVLLEHAVRFE